MSRHNLFLGIVALLGSYLLFKGLILACVFIILGAIVLVIIFLKDRKNTVKCAICITFFVILVIRFASLSVMVEDRNEELAQKSTYIEGIVTSVEYTGENFDVYNVKITKSSNKNANGILTRMNVYHGEKMCGGDRIIATANFFKIDSKYKASNYGNGIYYCCSVSNPTVLKGKSSTVYSFSEKLRTKIKGATYSNTSGEEAAVLVALIMGDRDNISDDLYRCVKNAGVSHMLVVSGMHLGIICGFLINLLRKTKINAAVSVCCSLIAVFLISIICLFHISILRAGLVYIIMLIGRIIYKNSEPLNSLGFATFLLTLVYPYLFYNVAFLLSVAATFAVICPGKILSEAINFSSLNKYVGKLLESVWNVLAISVSAMICTMPIVVRYFGWVALASPISNLAVTSLISGSLILGVIAVLIYFIPILNVFSYGLFWVCEQMVDLFIKIIHYIGENGFGIVDIKEENSLYCLLISILFVLATDIFYKIRKERSGTKNAQRENPENIPSVGG